MASRFQENLDHPLRVGSQRSRESEGEDLMPVLLGANLGSDNEVVPLLKFQIQRRYQLGKVTELIRSIP